jgi:hypothetical protein
MAVDDIEPSIRKRLDKSRKKSMMPSARIAFEPVYDDAVDILYAWRSLPWRTSRDPVRGEYMNLVPSPHELL